MSAYTILWLLAQQLPAATQKGGRNYDDRTDRGVSIAGLIVTACKGPVGYFFPRRAGMPGYTPRSGSCCVSPPWEVTPAQAVPPDRDGIRLSYQIAATNFIRAGIRRHFKNGPPALVLFGLPCRPLTPLLPSLGLALRLGLPSTFGLLFSPGTALVGGPPFGIAFTFLASRA